MNINNTEESHENTNTNHNREIKVTTGIKKHIIIGVTAIIASIILVAASWFYLFD